MITHNELLETFEYRNGELYWKITIGHRISVGMLAGSQNNSGYYHIQYNRKLYKTHRLIWFYHHGVWPNKHLDHIDGNITNNSIENLRECVPAENYQNKKRYKTNTSGYIGVTFDEPSKKWKARIGIDGKRISLGLFDTPQDAHTAYLSAKKKYHTFHPHEITR